MRKILSIFLTAAMTLSLFAAIPLGASAVASSPAITFDTQAEYGYYSNEPGKNSSGAPQETGTEQGKAFKFETIPAGKDASVWASALRIAQKNTDGTVSSFKVTPGKTYNISFKYKNDQYINDYDWAEIYVKLLFVSPVNGMGNFLNAAGIGPDDWWPRAEPGNISRNATDGWVQYSQSFTVPDWAKPDTNSEVALVLNLGQTRTNVSFWVDDVLIEEPGRLKGTSVLDFETDEQRTYYGNKESSKSTIEVGTPTGETNYAAKYSTIISENNNGSAWNDTLRVSMTYPNGTRGPVTVEAGEKYNISFKVKAEALGYKIKEFYLCYAASVQSGYVLNGNTAPKDYQHKETFKNYYEIEDMMNGWVSFSHDFTVPDIGEFNQLALFPVVSDGWKLDNQVVWIDDVSITKKTSVIVHNDSLGDFTISPAYGTNINDAKLPFPNVKVVNWYTDSNRTQVYNGTMTYDTPELWVDIENIVGDFENGYDAAKDGWDGNTFYTEQYAGTTNSTALTNKGQAQTGIDNSDYPPIIKLINSDGSDFRTATGHIYKLSFDMKPVDPNTVSPNGIVAVMKDTHANASHNLPCYTLMNQETFEEESAKASISFLFDEAGGNYRNVSFTFDGTGNNVYITPWCAGTAVYFDNINIIDLTAQFDVTDSEGNVLASGYDGEPVTIPDAADPDFVYYQDENGAPVSTTVVRKDKALTKVNSQIAVTGSAFDSANSTLSFKTRFGGIGYTEANGGVTVNTITVGNTRYFVEDMGLLVAPTANVTGELTLDNLGDAIQISGTSLKYSKNGTDELTITAQITTSKYDRDYTVVGYVKCAGGKVIYSKTRNSIAKSYNAAAGIESVVNSAHIKTFGSANYKLVSNSEFNLAESLSNGWNPWGVVNNPSLTDATKPDCNYYSVESATYVDNGNLVLDLKRTGDNTYDLPELLSKYHFTTGYLEVKAKFANPSDFSCSIWLNSVAVPGEDIKYKPNDNDIYVWPEIDIMESFAPGSFSLTLHNWGTPPGGEFGQRDQIRLNDKDTNADHTLLDLTQYHTYGLERTPQVIRMYVDGKLYYELTYAGALATYNTNKKPGDYQYRTVNEIKALFENPTYLILGTGGAQSLAVGDSAKSTIDYVRFYK